MFAISLALGSSVCYGLSNFLGPQLVRRHTLVAVLIVSQLAALAVCVLYLLAARGQALPAGDTWLALLAGAGNAIGLIAFYKAAELGPLSVVAPIGAVGAVIPVVWGLTSGDALRASQIVGLVLALGGAALAARSSPPGEHATVSYRDPRACILWAAGSAIAFGVFLTALPKAAAHGRAWALLDARLALVALMVLWAGRGLGAIKLRRASLLLTVPGLLLVLGTLLYTTAADHGDLSLVSVLGSMFPVVTVGLGIALLKEQLSRTQAFGVAAALTGIVLIAL
jgi:drug/metabolite transporter (DMT)-like permease